MMVDGAYDELCVWDCGVGQKGQKGKRKAYGDPDPGRRILVLWYEHVYCGWVGAIDHNGFGAALCMYRTMYCTCTVGTKTFPLVYPPQPICTRERKENQNKIQPVQENPAPFMIEMKKSYRVGPRVSALGFVGLLGAWVNSSYH